MDLAGYANIKDLSYRRYYGRPYHPGNETWDDGYIFTAPVGRYKPNKWGLYDTDGNVSEWCEDYYGPYKDLDTTDPIRLTIANGREWRVIRGGDYGNLARTCAWRQWGSVERDSPMSWTSIGFRVYLRME
jgi:formylglycine-generating enzyme required for sulfatase activity